MTDMLEDQPIHEFNEDQPMTNIVKDQLNHVMNGDQPITGILKDQLNHIMNGDQPLMNIVNDQLNHVVNRDQLMVGIVECQIAATRKVHQCLGSLENFPHLQQLLPEGYCYVVCEFNRLEPFEDAEERFEAVLRVSASSEEEAVRWLDDFQFTSKTTWRVDKTYPDYLKKCLFKKVYHCQHNTRSTSHRDRNVKGCHRKNTNCPAALTLTVRKFTKKSRSKDAHGPEYALVVALRQTHNHLINNTDSLQHRPVSGDIRLKFTRLFSEGMRPPKALQLHRQELRREITDEEQYRVTMADRAICPDIQWCYRLYYKIRSAERNLPVTSDRIDALESTLRKSVDSLCKRIRQSPQTLVSGIEQFLATLNSVEEDSDLAEFFSSFIVPRSLRKESETEMPDNGDDETSHRPRGADKRVSRKRGRPRKSLIRNHTENEHAYSFTLPSKQNPTSSPMLSCDPVQTVLPVQFKSKKKKSFSQMQSSKSVKNGSSVLFKDEPHSGVCPVQCCNPVKTRLSIQFENKQDLTTSQMLSCNSVHNRLSIFPVSCYNASAAASLSSVVNGQLYSDNPAEAWTASYATDNGGRQLVSNEDMQQYILCEDGGVLQQSSQNIEYRNPDVASVMRLLPE